MAGNHLKKPQATQGKNFKITEDKYENIDYPVFCLKHLHKDYHIDKCTAEEKIRLLERLHKLSNMTWQNIQLAPKHGLGSEKIARTSIKAAIPGHITPEVNFLALRFDGMKPLVGYRSGFILHIIYLDRDFTLYDH